LEFDTSQVPITNYQLKPKEILTWGFYLLDSVPLYSNNPIEIADTVVDAKLYKRILFIEKHGNEQFKRIVYLTKEYSDNLFHVSLTLDRKYAPFKVVRFEDFFKEEPNSILYYIQESTKLTRNEKAVFDKWAYNARHTKLPVLTASEVFKLMH
jgi:hypothetical protein